MRKYIKMLCLSAALLLCAMLFVGCVPNYLDSASGGLDTYTINASFDEVNKKISAVETVEMTNKNGVTMENIKLHLYGNAYRQPATVHPMPYATYPKAYRNGMSYGDILVDSVKVNGTTTDFEIGGQDSNILTVPLNQPLGENQKTKLQIVFVLSLANVWHRLGYGNNTINLGNWYPILCAYSNGQPLLDPYYGSGDPFVSNMANYNVNITAPKEYVLASTGKTISTSEPDGGRVTHKLKAITVRDFAVVMSDKFDTLSEVVDGVTVNYFFFEDSRPNDSLITARDSLKMFNKLIGSYPYEVLNIVESDFCYGGMEYPNLVLIGSGQTKAAYEESIVHEVAHQWWYNLVGNDQVRNAWMDEGLASYCTMMFFQEHPEYSMDFTSIMKQSYSTYVLYVDLLKNYNKNIDTSLDRALNEYSNDNEYLMMNYLKGMLLFDSLRTVMGNGKFENGLKRYFNENKLTLAAPAAMVKSFERAFGAPLEDWFAAWLDGSVLIN